MLAEVRKYKCSLMLATQSLAVLDTPERNLEVGYHVQYCVSDLLPDFR